MLRTQISKEQIESLAEDVRTCFDPAALFQGLEYQQKGFVYNAEIKDNAYHAKVQGTRVFDAQIDLSDVASSRCTCGVSLCEHQAAAFFYAYAAFGRPDQIIKHIKPGDAKTSAAAPDQSSLHRITSMLTPTSSAQTAKLRESDPPDVWLKRINDDYRSFSSAHNHHKSHPFEYFTAFTQLSGQPADWWKAPYQPLFHLVLSLFVMRQADELYSALSPLTESKSTAFEKTDKMLSERIAASIKELSAFDWQPSHTPYLDMIARTLREQLLSDGDTCVDWLYLYRLTWSRLLQRSVLAESEQANLQRYVYEQQFSQKAATHWQTDRLLLAAAHADVMAGNDSAAIERLAALNHLQIGDFLSYLHSFTRNEQWDRLMVWLRWLLPSLKQAETAEFNMFCDYWGEAVKHGAPEEEWVDALRSLLPGSFRKYTALLMQTGKYQEWVSFHLAYGVSPLSVSMLDIKRIEEADPQLLLPLYHQAVERSISAKSRDGYKQATHLLSKLKLIYTQLHRTAIFEHYVHQLSLQYVRLRAFQEELRRGKLLT
jgi:hypothetical protein